MIRLYTFEYAKNFKEYRNNHSEMFKTTVMNDELDNRDIEIIKAVDKAEYVGNNTMRDRFGNIASINNLSTGVKTLLNIRWFIKHGKEGTPVNITSCGDNVFSLLVEEAKGHDLNLLTCNYSILCTKRVDILVNDNYIIGSFSELSSLGDKLYASSN